MLYRILTFALAAAGIVFATWANAETGKTGKSSSTDRGHVAFPGSDGTAKSATVQSRKSNGGSLRPTNAGKKTN
jgi:hypothetical protein